MANEIRTRRVALKRDLKAGTTSIDALLRGPARVPRDRESRRHPARTPKIGRVKATKILDSCRVSKTFGGLADRQRAELAARLNQ